MAKESGTERRGEIHLGDLARALGVLGWEDEAQVQAIARCLGFGLEAERAGKPPAEIYDHQEYAPESLKRREKHRPRPVYVPPTIEPPPKLPANLLPCKLKGPADPAPTATELSWSDADEHLLDESDEPPCARETLFTELTSRHIVSAALVTLRGGRQIDIPRLVSAVARRETVRALPRLTEPTLDRGCQLLLDYSATMIPFWADLKELITQVGDVVGPASTRVYSFDTRPTEAVIWTPEGKREPWSPDGRPVLAASDLGIRDDGSGSIARVEPDRTWNALAERCADSGSPLLVLIPWPQAWWPMALAGEPELIHWSPGTTAGMIRQKIGKGHQAG